MDSLLCILSHSVNFIGDLLIGHYFHPFPIAGLFIAMSSYHVQLTNAVLQENKDKDTHVSNTSCCLDCVYITMNLNLTSVLSN